MGDRDRRQLRPDPRRERIVVERDDRDVRRHREARVGERVVGAERKAVVEADERPSFAPCAISLRTAAYPSSGCQSTHRTAPASFETSLAERRLDAFEAFDRGEAPGWFRSWFGRGPAPMR